MRRPSPAMLVALLGVFLGLGGVGVAATGGNFILGQSNDADAKTSLTAGIDDRAMLITNLDTGSTAAGLSLKVAPHHAPLVVNADAGKATNLDADKLDGLGAESFTQGGGRFYSGHREGVSPGGRGTLLDLPGALSVRFNCGTGASGGYAGVTLSIDNLNLVLEGWPGATAPFLTPVATDLGYISKETVFLHALGSRPFNRMTFRPAVLVDARIASAFKSETNTCSFQAVGETFG